MAFELANQLKPSHGDAIEVVVAWKDTILSVFGFSDPGCVRIGGGVQADILIPTLPYDATYELLNLGAQTRLSLAQGMSGQLISSDARVQIQPGPFYVRQGEMACVALQDISLYIRHVPRSLKPVGASLFDLSSAETAGLVLALATTAMIGTYVSFFTARALPEETNVLEVRKAKVLFKNFSRESVTAKADPAPAPVPPVAPQKFAPPIRKPRTNSGAKPGGMLEAFASKGLMDRIQKSFSAENDLSQFVGSGHGAPVAEQGEEGSLKEFGTGRDAQAVSLGDGNSHSRDGKYLGVGGLGKRASAKIAVEGHEADVSTGMDREAIRRVIREHMAEIRSCYERELQRAPNLYGKLVLEWDIGESGRVERTGVKDNSMESQTVPECILAHLKTWKFPVPPSNQIGRVSYPFVFSSH